MLKGLDPLLTPDLLRALAAMGHGDEVGLVDANFPAEALARSPVIRLPVIRLPVVSATRVLDAVLSVLPLDGFAEAPAAVMQVVGDTEAIPPPVAEFQASLARAEGRGVPIEVLERSAFHERARGAFTLVVTGDRRPHANILLRKGAIFAG